MCGEQSAFSTSHGPELPQAPTKQSVSSTLVRRIIRVLLGTRSGNLGPDGIISRMMMIWRGGIDRKSLKHVVPGKGHHHHRLQRYYSGKRSYTSVLWQAFFSLGDFSYRNATKNMNKHDSGIDTGPAPHECSVKASGSGEKTTAFFQILSLSILLIQLHRPL